MSQTMERASHFLTITLTLPFALILFPLIGSTAATPRTSLDLSRRTGDCAAPSRCGRTSEAMFQCDKVGTDETELLRCICTRDPTWETDVLECALCWEAELPSYELGVALDMANKHICKPGPVEMCEVQCTIAWHVLNTCGDISSNQQGCICRYKYLWEPWIKPDLGFSCPDCLEGNDETALANQLRAWVDWPCEAMSPGPGSTPDTGQSSPDGPGVKDDAGTVGTAMTLLWALQALGVLV
ncbi:hypothetical protein V8F06_014015 [Rhypophila decipiens]